MPNCPRCQIVRLHSWCQIVRGAKLSWCQIVLRPVSNTHELPYTDSWNEMPIKMSCRRCESNWNSGDGCWGVWHGWCWKQMFQKRTFSAILTSKSPSLSRTFLLFFLGNPLPTKTEWFISWPSAMGWANDFFLGLRPGGGRAVAEHFYKVFKIFVFFKGEQELCNNLAQSGNLSSELTWASASKQFHCTLGHTWKKRLFGGDGFFKNPYKIPKFGGKSL